MTMAAFVGVAAASALQMSPVMVELLPGQQAASITLRNPGDKPTYGQVRVFRWSQRGDEDELAPTEDIVASPPLIRIPAKGEQLVRLVSRAGSAPVERSYRVLVDELPEGDDTPATGVNIRLRYSVPLFIQPAGTPGETRLTWQLRRDAQGWLLGVTNQGARRAQLSRVQLVTADGQVHSINEGLLGYALAGASRQWRIALKEDLDTRGALKIRANVNAQPTDSALAFVAAQ